MTRNWQDLTLSGEKTKMIQMLESLDADVAAAGGGGGAAATITKLVTSAQLKAMHTTPVILIPGVAGKLVWPYSMFIRGVGGTTGYSGATSASYRLKPESYGGGNTWCDDTIDALQFPNYGKWCSAYGNSRWDVGGLAGKGLVASLSTSIGTGDLDSEWTIAYALV